MKWHSYSYSMPCFRVRVRVLLTRSTSTKSQGKHRLILRNMRIAQLQSAPVAVASVADRLGTIDLPCATGGVLQCRAIVPNSSPRRASFEVTLFWLLSYSYSMKWHSYSYSIPYFRVRVRVLLTRSTSTKIQGKHRLKLRKALKDPEFFKSSNGGHASSDGVSDFVFTVNFCVRQSQDL